MNYYEILGVDNSASDDEIKKSYKKLASKHHPDRPGGNTQKFQEIQVAYSILSDPQKRPQYDAELAGGRPSGGMFDMLRRQFGFGPMSGRFNQGQPPPQRNQNVRILMQVELVDTLAEQTKILTISLPGGEKENIEIKIPRGVQDGETIRYAGLGGRANTHIPRADLYIQFQIRQNIDFEQAGVDLYKILTVNCLDAIVGCIREVTGLDNKVFKITIPAGTQHGSKFGIPNEGLYTTGQATRGRLIIVLNTYIPTNLTEQQLQIIRELQN